MGYSKVFAWQCNDDYGAVIIVAGCFVWKRPAKNTDITFLYQRLYHEFYIKYDW
jgi:hypothetical protein